MGLFKLFVVNKNEIMKLNINLKLNIMSKKTYHSAKTGRFVSKEFMKNNPYTTVVVTNIDLKQ
jgi:hypothetical protein